MGRCSYNGYLSVRNTSRGRRGAAWTEESAGARSPNPIWISGILVVGFLAKASQPARRAKSELATTTRGTARIALLPQKETVDTEGPDSIIAVAKLWANSIDGEGNVVMQLSDGSELIGVLQDSLRKKDALSSGPVDRPGACLQTAGARAL